MKTEPRSSPPNCLQCRHYYITHDAHFSYGCKAFNFKSQRQPMLDVVEASGQACQHFQNKRIPPGKPA